MGITSLLAEVGLGFPASMEGLSCGALAGRAG